MAEVLLARGENEFARFLEKGHDVSPTRPEAVNPARETPLGVREPVDEIETVGQLLEAAKMACGDLPSDAIGPLRTLLSVIKMLCATGPGLETDVRELIEAASMACVDLPPREARALRTLLRVASGKLGEAKAGVEARNDATAVVGLSGRLSGLDIEGRRAAASARPPGA